MLVLTRKLGESIVIGDDITVHVLEVGGRVRLGIDAPRNVAITRPDANARPKASATAEVVPAGRGIAQRMRSRSRHQDAKDHATLVTTAARGSEVKRSANRGPTRTGVSANSKLE